MGKVEREAAANSPDVTASAAPQRKKLDLSGIPIGIRFILHQPIILSSMILDFFASFFSSANSLMPFVARDILHVGAIGYGWLSAAQAIGSVGVGLILAQKPDLKHQGRLLLQGVTLFGVATIIFGLSKSFALTFFALILIGVGDAISTILRNTIRQLKTPDELRGRMVSINQIFFAGGPRLGEMESGLVAQLFNPPVAIISGGIGCLLSIIAVAAKWPQLGNYSREESPAVERVVTEAPEAS